MSPLAPPTTLAAADIVAILVIVGFVVVLLGAIQLGIRARRKNIREKLGAAGYEVRFKYDKTLDPTLFLPVQFMSDRLKTQESGLVWTARSATEPICILEHSYTTGSGKNRQTHTHTAIFVPAPRFFTRVTLSREHLFTRLGKVFGMKDLDLENPEFNKHWRLTADDENIALAAVGPTLQAFLAVPAKLPEAWYFGPGAVVMLCPGQLSPAKVLAAVERLRAFLDALEPEMRAQIDQAAREA